MKNIVSPILVITSLAFSGSALAEKGQSYFGASYHIGTYDETGFPEANPTALTFKAGKYLEKNVAMEARLGLGLTDDTVTYLGTDIDLEVKNVLSFFVKGDLNLSESANIYGLFGFTKGKLEASTSFGLISEDDSGLSYGLGIEAKMSNDLYFSGEYILYISEDDYDYNGFNFGITKLFN